MTTSSPTEPTATAKAKAVEYEISLKKIAMQKTASDVVSMSKKWLCSFLSSRELRTTAFLCCVIGIGFFCSGLIALFSPAGLALSAALTLFGGGGAMIALGAGGYGYAAGLFNKKKSEAAGEPAKEMAEEQSSNKP